MSCVQIPGRHPRCVFVAALAIAVSMQSSGASAQGQAVPLGSFTNPIYAAAPAGDPRLFVVERAGKILVIENGTKRATPFLDISDRVSGDSNAEGGLLSIAFADDYTQTGVFYVYYTGDIDPTGEVTFESRVSRRLPCSSSTNTVSMPSSTKNTSSTSCVCAALP